MRHSRDRAVLDKHEQSVLDTLKWLAARLYFRPVHLCLLFRFYNDDDGRFWRLYSLVDQRKNLSINFYSDFLRDLRVHADIDWPNTHLVEPYWLRQSEITVRIKLISLLAQRLGPPTGSSKIIPLVCQPISVGFESSVDFVPAKSLAEHIIGYFEKHFLGLN